MAGIGLTLPIAKGNRGYYDVSEDLLTQIKSNFINLIHTIKGERLNNPEFGCDIHQIVFDPNTENISDRARQAIEAAVSQWMPFLELQEFEVLTEDGDRDRNAVRLYIKYTISGSPDLSTEVLISL
jgi:uncharacterized protein